MTPRRSCASKDAGSTRSGSGPPSSAAAAGTSTTKSLAAVADLGYADCTATAFRPGYLEPGAPHLQLEEPVWLELGDGRRLLEVPTTHSIGMLARGLLGPFRRQIVHAYFHDTDLLDRRRAAALRVGLRFLGMKRTVTDLDALQRGLRPEKTMSFANSRA